MNPWSPTKWKRETRMWKKRLTELEKLGVVFVQSAGNDGYNPEGPWDQLVCKTGMNLPANLGSPSNNMIVVSSVNENGQWSSWASPWGADPSPVWGGQTGDITTYAQGDNVQVFWRGKTEIRSGTSFSAPIVVSLLGWCQVNTRRGNFN